MNTPSSIKHHALVASALLGLLLLTIGVAYVDFGVFNTPVAMLISAVKGSMILVCFMNIRRDGPLAMLFAAAGFFWLAILFTLTMSDLLAR